MDYLKIYNSIIERARFRVPTQYVERHHIIPKCMGGTNEKTNIVSLLPEEHYIAHLLLVKIYPKNRSLIFAANMMANRNNKSYGWIKREFAIENSKKHLGLKHTDEAKKKMSDIIAARWEGNREGFLQEQSRRGRKPKNKKDGYFKPKSEATKVKMSENALLRRPKIPCEVCGKIVDKPNYNNHFKIHRKNNDLQCL